MIFFLNGKILPLLAFYFTIGLFVDDGSAFSLATGKQEEISNGILNPTEFSRSKRDIRSMKYLDPDSHLELLHHRSRRGLGSWLKKVLHIKSTPKPTPRPSTTPPHRSTAPPVFSSEESQERQVQGQDLQLVEQPTKVTYVADQHGDTEIDWLLPPSLRRSRILGKKLSPSFNVTNNEQGQQQPGMLLPPVNGPEPGTGTKQRPRKKHRRRQRYSEEEIPSYSEEVPMRRRKHRRGHGHSHRQKPVGFASSYSGEFSTESSEMKGMAPTNKPGSTQTLRRSKRSSRKTKKSSPMTLPQVPITKISLLEDSIETASKEELRLLHELFINIVSGRCPKSLSSQFIDDMELNLFRIIDSSSWEDTQEETSPEMTTLIHQLVNCSIASEAQRDLLQMFLYQESHFHSPSHDLELGAPVYRSKRGRLKDSKKKPPSGTTSELQQLTAMSNFEFSLITFISDECKQDVNQALLHSASQLILETIHKKFKTFIPISEKALQDNLSVLQFCAGVIMKHREKEMRMKRKLQDQFKNFTPTSFIPLQPSDETETLSGGPPNSDYTRSINNNHSSPRPSVIELNKEESGGNKEFSSIFDGIPFLESQWKTQK